MHNIADSHNIIPLIKVALLTMIPVMLLFSFLIYYKNRMDKEIKAGDVDLEALREEMKRIAQEKLAQRDLIVKEDVKETPKLEKTEIEEKIESEREDYDEFELVNPLEDIVSEDDDQTKKDKT